MRAAANTLWLAGAGSSTELPDLMHPYFSENDQGDLATRAKLLDAKIAEMKRG